MRFTHRLRNRSFPARSGNSGVRQPQASISARLRSIPPAEVFMPLHRREFLQRAAAASVLLGLPLARAEKLLAQDAPALPPAGLYSADPEHYWALLRRQWLLAADRINLNCGSLGCPPLPVLRAMVGPLLSAAGFGGAPYPWLGYEEQTRIRA